MFSKKPKKTIYSEVFSEMKYTYGWEATTKAKLTLWNKTYNVDLVALARTDDIDEKQEIAYRNLKETIVEKQKEIEETLENHFNIRDEQVLASRFTPMEFLFCRNGNYGLLIEDAEDEDIAVDPYAQIAISMIPELKVCPQEEYISYARGEGYL